jgi:hypothetical protein
MVSYLKGDANFKYSYSSDHTLTGYSDGWGTPMSDDRTVPITYSGPMNIIYFNMNGDRTIKLTGGAHGAGILLVDGNLEIDGGFTWYGIILATGTVAYTGSGQKNITGGMMAGENATTGIEIDENAGILYCSAVAKKLKEVVPPLKITRWREIF